VVGDATGWRERQGYAGGEGSISADVIGETCAAAGACVGGWRMFDGGEIPWVTPRAIPGAGIGRDPSTRRDPGAGGRHVLTLVTGGIGQAVALAREATARTWPSPAAGPCGGGSSGPAWSSSSSRTWRRWCLVDDATSQVLAGLVGEGSCLYDVADGSVGTLQNLGRR
jgi:uncharacterized Fe-S cluster protein YjdI